MQQQRAALEVLRVSKAGYLREKDSQPRAETIADFTSGSVMNLHTVCKTERKQGHRVSLFQAGLDLLNSSPFGPLGPYCGAMGCRIEDCQWSWEKWISLGSGQDEPPSAHDLGCTPKNSEGDPIPGHNTRSVSYRVDHVHQARIT